MAESAAKKNSLTPTQEGLIAGVVILFFGLLYWYLNPWKSEDKTTPVTTQHATGDVVRSSLVSDTSPSASNNITGNFTDNIQTTTSTTSNTEVTSSNTTTPTAASVAPPPYPSETTAKPLASTEATKPTDTIATNTEVTKVASTTTAAITAEPTQEPAATPTASSTQTATKTAVAPTSIETVKPADGTTSTDTTKVETSTETAAAPTATADTSTEAAKPADVTANAEAAKTAPATETAASTTTASPAATETTSTTATQITGTNSNTTSGKQSTTAAASKLVLAPNSPEAKLQSYLETGTLETPVMIPNLQFEPKATKLTQDSEAEALMLAALLGQYPQANFLITAYTTESTKEQNSEQLSLQRANALGEELVKAGIDGKRITIMGMGNKPAADKSSAAQKKNQRIEISVIQ